MSSQYKNSLTFSLVKDMKMFNEAIEAFASIEMSVRNVRSTLVNISSYVDPIVEALSIVGLIPNPKDKTKKRIKNELNSLFKSLENNISLPLDNLNKSLTFASLSLKDIFFILDKSTNYIYSSNTTEYDDDSLVSTLEKYSTQLINSFTTVFKTFISVVNDNYSYLTEVLNSLISNICVKIAGVINGAVETDNKMSPDELSSAVNIILGSTILQPIISQLENNIIRKIYDNTEPLRNVGNRIGEILRWNFSML